MTLIFTQMQQIMQNLGKGLIALAYNNIYSYVSKCMQLYQNQILNKFIGLYIGLTFYDKQTWNFPKNSSVSCSVKTDMFT